MNLQISANKNPNENTYSKVADAKSDKADKAKSTNQKSAPTKPKTDTLQLSATAQTNAKTQVSASEQAKQLEAEGKTITQIAASLGISITTVESYLGISPTAANSNANSAAVPTAAAPVTTPVTSAAKSTTIA